MRLVDFTDGWIKENRSIRKDLPDGRYMIISWHGGRWIPWRLTLYAGDRAWEICAEDSLGDLYDLYHTPDTQDRIDTYGV